MDCCEILGYKAVFKSNIKLLIEITNKMRLYGRISCRQPQTYVKPEAAISFLAPDDEGCVARNMLSN